MTRTISAHSLRLQDAVQRNVVLNDLAHWFVQVLPKGVLASGNAHALYQDYLRQAHALEQHAGVTDTELLVLLLSASTCLGHDYAQPYPAAHHVLHSRHLSQPEKAQWFEHFLGSFAYLGGARFAPPIQRQPAPHGLLTPEELSP